MASRRWTAVLLTVMITSALLSGCTANKAGIAPTHTASSKPVLVVPTTFENESAKKEFVAKAVAEGYYVEAKPLLEAMAANSTDATALAQLGTVRYNLKELTGAMEAWNRVATLQPERAAEMKNNIGNALRDSLDFAGAEAAYREAIVLDPAQWQAAINLASMLKVNSKVAEAIEVLELAASRNEGVAPISVLLKSFKTELNQG